MKTFLARTPAKWRGWLAKHHASEPEVAEKRQGPGTEVSETSNAVSGRRRSARRLFLILAIVLGCVGCDQATKRAASLSLKGEEPVSLLGDTVRLSYHENAGGFLSLGSDLPKEARFWAFFVAPTLVILGITILVARRPSLNGLDALALSLMCAGALGNVIDRASLGVVRDFLNVGIGPLRTGIFNVADVSITLAVALLVARHLRASSSSTSTSP